jgi:hypothetical protein
VELLVVAAVGAAVLAILLVTFDRTQRLTRREIGRNHQRQVALLTLERVSAILADAVPLSSLDVSTDVEEILGPDHMRVASWHGADAGTLWLHDIAHEVAEADEEGATPRLEVTLGRIGLDGAPAPGEVRRADLPTSLSLRYAAGAGDDGEVDWEASPEPGEFPALVQVTVITEAADPEQRPFVVSTVVATGIGGAP